MKLSLKKSKPSPADEAVLAVRSLGFQNPLDDRETVIMERVGVEVVSFDNAMVLQHIRSFAPGSGNASEVLKMITDIADAHGVPMMLDAKPTGKGGLSKAQLLKWYGRHGFKRGHYMDGGLNDEMSREPKRAKSNNPPDQLRLHISGSEIASVRSVRQFSGVEHKPQGFWYACGTEWLDLVTREDWKSHHGDHFYNVILKPGANILRLSSPKDIDKFDAKYATHDHPRGIDWSEVAEKYDGIEICPHQDDRKFSTTGGWYQTWDVASGVFWNADVVEGIEEITSLGQLTKKQWMEIWEKPLK